LAHAIPEEIIRRIRDAANIVEVVSESVALKKTGRNHIGLCPFHAEKTPSFTVNDEKQIFYCFGCGVGGNIFSFLMQQDGLSFPDAVRSVARRYSIDVPDYRLSPAQQRQLSEKERIYQINETAATYYQQMLKSPHSGQKAMGYLLQRGMTKKIIEGFRLGYASNSWDGLLRHGQGRKLEVQKLHSAGLIIGRKDKSGYYDRFRDRIIFPIFNSSQQVIGFGGRVMGDDLPKYLNSPETPVFNKSGALYGIHRARQAARSLSLVYVVEGYFDVLAMHLYGIENTVASLGTALTLEHIQMLKGLVGPSGKAVLVYDADQAGMKAAQRSIPVFEQGLLDARILVLPTGYDPDLYLREFGPEKFHQASEQASGMMGFLMESAVAQFGLSLEGKVKIVAAMQKPLAAVTDNVARTLYVQQLAERLNIDESAILEKVRQSVAGKHSRNIQRQPDQLASAGQDDFRLEQQIIAMMVHFPEIVTEIIGRNLLDDFEDPALKQIAVKLTQTSVKGVSDIAEIITQIDDPRYRSLMAQVTVKDHHVDRSGCMRLLAQFEAKHRKRAKEALQRQIIEAEKNNDMALLSKLLRQKQKQAFRGFTD